MLVPLSHRQQQVLSLLCQGDRPKDIAHQLGVGIETVKMHISAAKAKLGAGTTIRACILFERHYRADYSALSTMFNND